MKKEGWTPTFINGKIDEYLEELKTNDEYIYQNNRTGKWKKGDYKSKYYDEIEEYEKQYCYM